MGGRTHDERDAFEDRFFDQQQHQFDRFEVKLDKNTAISQKALAEAQKTNSRVTHVERDIKTIVTKADQRSKRAITVANRSKVRLVDLEKIIIPDKPPEPSDLQSVWKDPLIRKIIFIVGGAIILVAIGFSNDEIKGLFSG